MDGLGTAVESGGGDKGPSDSGVSRLNLLWDSEKCVFAVPAIEFVGFHLSADGMYPLHSNIHPPCPGAHLGLSGGLLPGRDLCFLPQYSATTVPLRNMLDNCLLGRHGPPELTSPPVLAHFDPTLTWSAPHSSHATPLPLPWEQ